VERMCCVSVGVQNVNQGFECICKSSHIVFLSKFFNVVVSTTRVLIIRPVAAACEILRNNLFRKKGNPAATAPRGLTLFFEKR
jgi:hypothetical protein